MSYSRNSGIGWLQYHTTPNIFQSGNPMMMKSLAGDIQSRFMDMSFAIEDMQSAIEDSLANGFSGLMNIIDKWGTLIALEQHAILEQSVQINKHLETISQQLETIHHTLKTPHQTKAIEFRTIGLERVERGLLDEALESFNEAEKLDHTDFITMYNKGKIYLYGDGLSAELINLQQAGKYFKDTMKYLSAEIKFLQRQNAESESIKQLNSLFSNFLLHYSQYYYVCGNEAYLKNNKKLNEDSKQNYKNMLQYASLSEQVIPSGEAKFVVVKAYLMLGDIETAVLKTRTLLTHNFDYLYKLQKDEDCKDILPRLNDVILDIHPTGSGNLAMHSYVLMGLDQNKALESAKQAIHEDTDIYKRFAKPIFKPITPQIDNCMFWETVKHLEPDIPKFNEDIEENEDTEDDVYKDEEMDDTYEGNDENIE